MSRKRFQRIVTLVSIVSFFGSIAYGAVGAINSSLKQPRNDATTAAASRESQLQAQERGYKLVLQREPENRVALEGLVQARLEMKDVKGAIAPLDKLVKLYPNRQDYKMVLAQVKKRVGGGDRFK
jgi:cytochrome c-type biogenesis protein CcmH/NrfG